MKKIEPIEYDQDGNITYNLNATAADDDWIRAGRLAEKAKAGDEEARKQLEEMENTPMHFFTLEEIEEVERSIEKEKKSKRKS